MLPVISHTSTVEELFLGRTFVAASVQRDFQWNAPECETLLADLVRAWGVTRTPPVAETEPTEDDDQLDSEFSLLSTGGAPPLADYFLGAIVTRTADDGTTEIYDGLQRITTLTILMAVLRDTTGDPTLSQRLDKLINERHNRSRLMLPKRDWVFFKEIQKPGEADKVRRSPPISDFHNRLREAARVFRPAFAAWTEPERVSFALFLLNRIAVVVVTASSPRLARQIFVTTNLRGVPLNQADLFKGQLLDLAPNDSIAGEMEAAWTRVVHAVGDDLVPFLTAVDTITRRQEQGADCLEELIDHLSQRVARQNIGGWAKRLTMFASAWNQLHARLERQPANSLEADVWRLGLFRWQQWKPLALLWHADFIKKSIGGVSRAAQAAHIRRFQNLHRRCMAITLAGLNQNQRSQMFNRGIAQAIKGRNCLNGALAVTDPMRRNIEQRLSTPFFDEDRRVVLFRWMESLCWDNPPLYVAQGTLEHILPQNPGPGSQWLHDFPFDDKRQDLCNNIGNFALVDVETNNLLGNADFLQKQPTLASQADIFRNLRGLDAMGGWKEQEILNRGTETIDKIMEALRLSTPAMNLSAVPNTQYSLKDEEQSATFTTAAAE